jgi:hypothetical protein
MLKEHGLELGRGESRTLKVHRSGCLPEIQNRSAHGTELTVISHLGPFSINANKQHDIKNGS